MSRVECECDKVKRAGDIFLWSFVEKQSKHILKNETESLYVQGSYDGSVDRNISLISFDSVQFRNKFFDALKTVRSWKVPKNQR